MKVVILAGGFGTRLSEDTSTIPKPMVKIGDKPILIHLMEIFSFYGHNEFYLALGYKADYIKDYFLKYKFYNSDISIDLERDETKILNNRSNNWKINLIETGDKTMTGGRLKRMKNYINDDTFMLTYGDGLGNINVNSLIEFHKSHGKLATVTAVRPIARFGELEFHNSEDTLVKNFNEKPQINQGWINGGFFVFNRKVFDFIDDDKTVLEKKPLENLAKKSELKAFKHDGFWQCMDTKRDKDYLNELESKGQTPWKY